MLELEKQFEGKDICFVSISVDSSKNIDLWKKTIKQMGLKGIQLHLGEQWDWLKTFMPSSISVPRFIILDREGRIIDAHAPRPSDKGIAAKLEALIAGGQQSAGISFFQGSLLAFAQKALLTGTKSDEQRFAEGDRNEALYRPIMHYAEYTATMP